MARNRRHRLPALLEHGQLPDRAALGHDGDRDGGRIVRIPRLRRLRAHVRRVEPGRRWTAMSVARMVAGTLREAGAVLALLVVLQVGAVPPPVPALRAPPP